MPRNDPRLRAGLALVTGAGSGLGRALAIELAGRGLPVVGLGRRADALAETTHLAGPGFHAFPCDIADFDALRAAFAKADAIAPLTLLINNAAHDERHTLKEVTSEYFDDRIRVNLKHQFFTIQAVVDDMKKAGNGAIVNMGSTSWMVAFGGLPVYTAAKAGVIGLTRGLAHELGQHNIRINSVAPGWIMTKRQKELWVTPEALEQLMRDQCLQRTLGPDDIARAVLFYASDEASAVTNQSIVFDGGWL